jgi:putative flippase GtrA
MVNFSSPDFHHLLKHQFARFLFVGFFNSLFGYSCFAILLYVGLHYALALFLATILGVAFNFKSTGALVFGSHNNRLIIRFIASYAAIYFVNAVGIKILSHIGVTPYISGAVLIFPMAVLAFILNKRFVFNYG